jgi:tetratricopeptide (TPR) repeat protein
MATVAPLVARGERAASAGDWDAAVEAYQQALELTPWNSRIERALVATYVARASAQRSVGKAGLERAEADLRAALAIAPADPEVRRNLAVVLIDRASNEADDQRHDALRAEAGGYAPELVAATPEHRRSLERRIDLAFELLERGQLEAGIYRLERLHAERPERSDVTRLLAQAHVRHGSRLSSQQYYERAGLAFDRALALYAELGPCDGTRCDAQELLLAHHNRVVAWLSAARAEDARRALGEAERAGVDVTSLRDALLELEGAQPWLDPAPPAP